MIPNLVAQQQPEKMKSGLVKMHVLFNNIWPLARIKLQDQTPGMNIRIFSLASAEGLGYWNPKLSER